MAGKLSLLASFAAGTLAAGAGAGIATTAGSSDPDSASTTGSTSGSTTAWLTAKVADAMGTRGVVTWVPTGSFATSAEVRVPRYPFTIDGKDTRKLSLSAVRGEQVSAQIAIAAGRRLDGVSADVGDLTGPGGARLPAPQVRFVRYVPVMRSKSETDWSATVDQVASAREVSGDRNPDVVGDPLEEGPSVDVPAYAAQPLWFTFHVPADAGPGSYTGTIEVAANGRAQATYPLTVEVADAAVPDASAFRFFLDVWLQPETIARAHGVRPWSRRHWELIEVYQRDLLSRGQKVINTTIVHDPWRHQWALGRRRSQTYLPYGSMIGWTWDGTRFGFDFARFDRYVGTARRAGLGPTIGAYSMLAFHDAEHLTYVDTRSGRTVRENVKLGGGRWKDAWRAFLTAFQAHLEDRGWLKHTWLSFDERPVESMKVVRDLVHEAAPAFDDRIAVAGSVNTEPIASNLSVDWGGVDALTPAKADERRRAGKITTFYVYGRPPHPNVLSYSPAIEGRMLPWIAASRHLDGFLRWSYNSWPRDVFREPVFVFTQGDEYLVYPGPDGPMSSIRWEQLREGVEDYELIAQARRRRGGDTDALRQAFTLATRDLDGRTKNPADMAEARRLLLRELTG
ncbi:glycoside hydrolase domain-containing protein [Actinomadura sp. NPDC047616]|uniref:DUF4091 domain-containing protein n=1 Tax=Actinomadura sp. NPDC047616 TaxID=3155914 RepID=UPI0033FB85A9